MLEADGIEGHAMPASRRLPEMLASAVSRVALWKAYLNKDLRRCLETPFNTAEHKASEATPGNRS